MYQIARPERDIFAQLFLELSDIISSHHYDALIHKSFISWWLRFVKFHILARFLFFSLITGRAGPPRILTRAPLPSSPSCLVSQIYFGRFFCETEVKPPHPPRWSEVQRRPLLQIQMGGSSPYSAYSIYSAYSAYSAYSVNTISKQLSDQIFLQKWLSDKLLHLWQVTRERALGGSRGGSKRSWREALLIPPTSRLTELLTRKRVIVQDKISSSLLPWETRITFLWEKPLVAFPHWAKTSLSTLGIISTRRTGRLASVFCSLRKTLHWIWSKGRLGLRIMGRVEGLHLGALKIFQNRFVRQDEEPGGPALPSKGERNKNLARIWNFTNLNHHEIKLLSIRVS